MGGVDHHLVRLAALCYKACEDPIKHTHPAPAHKTVIERLVRPVGTRRIAPTQPVANDEDDARDDLAVIDPRNTVRHGKERFDPAHLRHRQPKQITHNGTSMPKVIHRPLNPATN